MIDVVDIKSLINALDFCPEDGSVSVWTKSYSAHSNYKIKINIDEQKIDYGREITIDDKTICNFKKDENFVVLECVNRLLEKGYKPKNITLEKTWATGHGTSGKLDILAIIAVIVLLVFAWIPFLIFNIDANLEPSQLLAYVIDNYTYTGIRGLLVAGIVAMAMSTADSYINSCAVLFSNDICSPLNLGKNKELLISKIFTFLLGGLGIMLALVEQDLLSMVLIAHSFYMPIVTIPLIFSILGFRSSTTSVLVGMGTGFLTIVAWKLFKLPVNGIVCAMFINLTFLMGSHYLFKQPGGWIAIRTKTKVTKKNKTIIKNFKDKLYNFNFIAYCKKYFPTNELTYTGLGLYIILFSITTMYSTRTELFKESSTMILSFYQVMLISGMAFLMRPIWPRAIDPNKKIIFSQVLWPLVIFYILILLNTFFVIASNFNTIQFGLFVANILISAFLIGWRLATVFIVVGTLLGIKLHQYYNPSYNFSMYLGSPAFITTYVLMLIGGMIVLFIRPKQEQLDIAENTVRYLDKEVNHLEIEVTNLNNKVNYYSETVILQEQEIARLSKTAETILNNVNHNLRLPIGNVINFAEMLKSGLEKYGKDHLKILTEEVYKNSSKVSTMILNMLDLAMLQVKKIQLEKTTINFSEMVINRIKACKSIYLEDKNLIFKLDIEPEILIVVDPNYMRQTIDNLVINSIKYSKKGVISIKLRKVKDYIEFSISDEGIGIPKTDLMTIFEPFIVSSKTKTPAGNRGVGLSLCKSAVVAHKGEIKAASNGIVGASFSFKLPIIT